jgi:PEP-CTERM motif
MSRLLSILLGAVVAISATTANAAFTFSFVAGPSSNPSFTFSNPTASANPLSSGVLLLQGTSNTAADTFTLGNISLSLAGLNPADFSATANFTPGAVITANGTTQTLGTVTFNVLASAKPQISTATLNAVILNQANGFIGLQSANLVAVPEPSSLLLIGATAIGFAVIRRRRRK